MGTNALFYDPVSMVFKTYQQPDAYTSKENKV